MVQPVRTDTEAPEPPVAESFGTGMGATAAAVAASLARPSPDMIATAESAGWERRCLEQREAIARSERTRIELRAAAEEHRVRLARIMEENERLASPPVVAAATSRFEDLQGKLQRLENARNVIERHTQVVEEDLAAERGEASVALPAATAAEAELRDAERRNAAKEAEARDLESRAALAVDRLSSMVKVDELHRHEAEVKRCRDALISVDREALQLRTALADASSSDFTTAKQELNSLRDSTEAATKRVQDLEELNEKFEKRLAQLDSEIFRLRAGASDLRHEEELMREVIVQQNQSLLARVEELAEEQRVAAADRRTLLATAAELLRVVEEGDIQMEGSSELAGKCKQLDLSQQTLLVEVERLKMSNAALCEQVLSEDGEGPFAGCLQPSSHASGTAEDELLAEVSRLVRGQPLLTCHGDVRADAAALALKLQQALAEREEAFWIERQRLSDRVTALERTRGGRTGALLRDYGNLVQESKPQSRGWGKYIFGQRRGVPNHLP